VPLVRVRLWDGSTAWLVTRYAEQRALLADPRLSADPYRPGYPFQSQGLRDITDETQSFLNMDDPEHARLRRMVAGTFTVRVTLYPDDYAWVEVIDQGGEWTSDHRRHGLTALASIAGDGNWGIDGDEACHVAWFRLNLPHPHPGRAAAVE